jgi:UV DNA damage endonuclease
MRMAIRVRTTRWAALAPARFGRPHTDERLVEKVAGNLACLRHILNYNLAYNLLFFRITSDLVLFASHPVCRYDRASHFADEFSAIGRWVINHGMRISMHPDQFTLLNSPDEKVVDNSLRELIYHAQVLDLMGVAATHKIQIHVGGVYGDKPAAMQRFVTRYRALDEAIRRRLVIENDDSSYTVEDCLSLHDTLGVPVVLDTFHHILHPGGMKEAAWDTMMAAVWPSWTAGHGIPMVDYSAQQPDARRGRHADSVNDDDLRHLLEESQPHDFDLMLEIKNKEASALRAIQVARGDPRLVPAIGPDSESGP